MIVGQLTSGSDLVGSVYAYKQNSGSGPVSEVVVASIRANNTPLFDLRKWPAVSELVCSFTRKVKVAIR